MACCFWIGIRRINHFKGYVDRRLGMRLILIEHRFEIGFGDCQDLCGQRIKYDEESRTIPLHRQQRGDESIG